MTEVTFYQPRYRMRGNEKGEVFMTCSRHVFNTEHEAQGFAESAISQARELYDATPFEIVAVTLRNWGAPSKGSYQ